MGFPFFSPLEIGMIGANTFALLSLLLVILSLSYAVTTDPLACILHTFSYTFPEIDIDLDGKTLTITDLTCSGFDLATLPSTFKPPTTLEIGATGLKTTCSGNYNYGILHQTVTIALDVDVDLDVYVKKENDFPVYTNFSSCAVSRFEIDLDFSSSILDAFAPLISSFIQKKIYESICVTMNNAYSTKVTEALLTKIDPKIVNITASEPSPYPEYESSHYVDWNNSTYSELRDFISTLRVSTDLPTLLKCMATAEDNQPSKLATTLLTDGLGVQQGEDGAYTGIFFDEPIYILPGLGVEILSTKFHGLDTLKDLEILEPMEGEKVVLRTALAFETLEADIRMRITVNGSMISPDCMVYQEEIMFTFGVQDSSFVADLVLAVDGHLLRSFHMDQLSSLSCWLSTVAELSLPNVALKLDLTDISIKQIRGDSQQLEKDATALLDNIFQFLFAPEAFKTLTEEIVMGVLQGPLRTEVNKQLANKIAAAQAANPCLTHYPYDDVHEYLEWPKNDVIAGIDKLINEKVGYEGVNNLMTCATNGTGAISIDSKFFHISLTGLNSFFGLELFTPVYGDDSKKYNLQNYLAAGYCPSGSEGTPYCKPIGLYLEVNPTSLIHGQAYSASDTGNMKLAITLENFVAFLDNVIQMDKDVLKELQFNQMGTTGCLASSLAALVFDELVLNVTKADLIYHDDEMDQEITGGIQRILGFFMQPQFLNNKNIGINASLTDASPTCKNNGVNPNVHDGTTDDGSSDNGIDWKWQLTILVVGCTASLAGLLMAYHYWGKAGSMGCLGVVNDDGTEDNRPAWERYAWGEALLFHHQVPAWVRYSIPIAVLGTMGMFLSSNLCPDAVSVIVTIITPTQTIDVGSIFEFGLASTVHDMWQAGVYPLSILIAFFSGAWPYVKLAAMFMVWVLPPVVLSVKRRESILILLDMLGKWSLIDFFVMVLMLCAFFFELIVVPQLEVKVTVLPKWGFYSFLLATMISLGLGHTILACHRLVVEPKVPAIPVDIDPVESLSSVTYEVDVDEEDSTYNSESMPLTGADQEVLSAIPGSSLSRKRVMFVTITTWGKVAVLTCIALTSLTILLGTILYTMGFEFKGLTGLFLKDDAFVDYSFVSVGSVLPEHSGHPSDFSIRWLQASYFLFGVAMPLAFMVCLFVLWLVPLTLDRQRQCFVLAEVLNAWSTLDVFCVSIAAALLEIQQFAAFIVGDSCDKINKILEQFLDEQLDGDDKCFDVVAYVKTVRIFLFAFSCSELT
ncbi:hypothetical protein EON65_12820 [archaeon]|nr:MAG: hypothetical protein EON65_12820 [archaeon]